MFDSLRFAAFALGLGFQFIGSAPAFSQSLKSLVTSPGSSSFSATQIDLPNNSWESWIEALRAGASPPPTRPDRKNISLPLPIWVDCHLSWASDRPKGPTKITLSGEIVLVGSPKLCKGQLEEWAVE